MAQPSTSTARPDHNSSWEFTDSYLPSQMLITLNEQRQEGLFCDVVICIEGREFQCHRNILSAFSPYFRAMFQSSMQESKMDRIDIHEVDVSMFQLLIDFAYSGKVMITEENVKSLLATANFFEVLSVRDACCKYIGQHLNETNCISIFAVSDTHFCINLRQKVKKFILANFEKVYIQPEFVSLGVDELIELIADDNLCVSNEREVFAAVTSWLEFNKETRKQDFEKVIEHVRFPMMSTAFLLYDVERYCHTLNSDKCRELIEEAKVYYLLPDKRKAMENSIPRARPRLSNCAFASRLETIGGCVKLHLNNVSKLTNESRESPLFELRNLYWSLKTKLRGSGEDRVLAAYIQFKTKDTSHGPVTCNARVRIDIKSRKMNGNYNKSYTHIHRAGKSTGWSDFISYEELMNPFRGYYDEVKDSICFLVNIQADCPQYGDADDSSQAHHSTSTADQSGSLPIPGFGQGGCAYVIPPYNYPHSGHHGSHAGQS